MLLYIAKRLIMIIPVFIGVSAIAFTLLQLAPGDPVEIWLGEQGSIDPKLIETYRHQLGLDQPIYVQYGQFLWRLLHGDLGVDFRNNRPALEEALEALPRTIELAIAGIFVSVGIGLPAGIYASKRQNRLFDHLTMIGSYIGASIPVFWLALILIIIFSFNLSLTPVSGFGSPSHLILPALALGLNQAAVTARFTRSSMLEVIRQDWVIASRAHGIRERFLTYRFILKSALIPIITVVGLQFGFLISNAFFIEYIFGWPGIGRLALRGIQERNYAVIQSAVLLISVTYILINLAVDIIYRYIDPRVKFESNNQE